MNRPGPLSSLRSFTRSAQPRPGQAAVERCELCSAGIPARHQHLIDPAKRALTCVCDACAMLFDSGGLTKLKRVPRDPKLLSEGALGDSEWERFPIPVGLAFFYKSSYAGKVVALYPSSAGVTESELELGPWNAFARGNGTLTGMLEDVEALLVNRLRGKKEALLSPIDRCFELVGIIKRYWEGFSGGDRVHEEMERFFAKLRAEARP